MGLVLQEVSQAQLPGRGEGAAGGGLPHQPDLMKDGPPYYIDEVVGLQYGVAYVLPTPLALVLHPVL